MCPAAPVARTVRNLRPQKCIRVLHHWLAVVAFDLLINLQRRQRNLLSHFQRPLERRTCLQSDFRRQRVAIHLGKSHKPNMPALPRACYYCYHAHCYSHRHVPIPRRQPKQSRERPTDKPFHSAVQSAPDTSAQTSQSPDLFVIICSCFKAVRQMRRENQNTFY